MNWNRELAAARSAEDVLAVANGYFAAARSALGERLPASTLPESIADVSELHAAQRKAVDAFMSNPVHALDLEIQDLCGFTIRALARALELSDKHCTVPCSDARYRASSFDDRAEL